MSDLFPQVEESSLGVSLPLHATAGARRNSILGWRAGRLKVSVTQVAEKGKANQAILRLLAKSLKLAKSRLKLISGETSRDKLILVESLTKTELLARIASATD